MSHSSAAVAAASRSLNGQKRTRYAALELRSSFMSVLYDGQRYDVITISPKQKEKSNSTCARCRYYLLCQSKYPQKKTNNSSSNLVRTLNDP